MLTGKIFQEVTGRDYRECSSTIEIWEAVKSSKQIQSLDANRHKCNVVSNRGGVFDHMSYDDDIDNFLK